MSFRTILLLSITCIYLAFAQIAFSQEETKTARSQTQQTKPSTIRKIYLPHNEPDLPALPGREKVLVNCGVCHSLRYITNQPDFPEKTWKEIVKKMTTKFGAHVTAEDSKAIVEFLVSFKGKPAQPSSETPSGAKTAR